MVRRPIYLIFFLLIFGTLGYIEYQIVQKESSKIERMENELINQFREFSTYKNYVYQFSLPASRSFLFIDMRELGDDGRKMSFLKDYFQSSAKQYGLDTEVKVESGQFFDWMNVLSSAGGLLKVYRVNMEIQNYSNLPALLEFLKFLKNFPVVIDNFEAGTGGEKKGYIKLTFQFVETFEE